ncbi:AsmA family protein [Hyphomicrobium sp.]|uniref:AsmA family protein n=1 Tax=Hyphomicrobium sp. TaxID=82 RepID=UPI001D4112EE|nr:AsmA family protein [Hyphomicrobium sp.]MBY0561062.1 AsmA family protein [Hyphomicrobium sp.]
MPYTPAPPPLPTIRPSFERAPLGSGPRRTPPPPGGGGGRRGPPARRGGLWTGILYALLFIVAVGGAGIGYLLLNPPSDLIRQKIAEEVKARTGRDLIIAGRASFTFFPVLGLSLKDVSLSGPPGMDGPFLNAQALEASLDPMTLLERQPKITAVTLKSPVLDLRIDKEGRRNWKFAARSAPTRLAELQMRGTQRDTAPIEIAMAEAGGSGTDAADLKIENVRLENGTFRFTDDRTGKISEVSQLNVTLGLPSLQSPLVANGNLVWRDQRLDFDGKVADVRAIATEKPTQLSFNARNSLITASYEGGVILKDGATLDGKVSAQSNSTRGLATWFGTQLPPVSGFGPMSIQGTLKTAGNVTVFSDAAFSLDGAAASGQIKVTTGGVRPLVEADLAVSELDLNKYLTSAVTGGEAGPVADEGQGKSAATPAAPAPESPVAPKQPTPATPDQIQKLLEGSKVYGFAQREGWSSEPLNLTLLGVADGSARVSVEKLHFKNMSIGKSSVDVAVKNLAMQAKFNDVALYKGHGSGVLAINGSGGNADVTANFKLDNVSAFPFLKDAANFGWVSGNANVALQLSANGANQLQLVESLNGTAGFQFADGAIVGFNLPGAIHGLTQGNLGALRTSPSEKTDFTALGASFTITNGVAQNQDLQLISPMLKVTGAGTAHMPERTIDYTVRPKLVAAAEPQKGNSEASGIEVPVHITGSWDQPSYRPDFKAVLSDQDKTVETIKQIGKKFKGKNANEIVDQLFGKKADEDPTSSAATNKKKAKDLLNKFLGKEAQ